MALPREEPAERPMRSLRDELKPKREPTPVESEAIEEVRTMAVEHAAGRLPVQEVRRLTNGKQRWLATRFTPPDHPAFRPLMALLDALIATEQGRETGQSYPTKHGVVTQADTVAFECKIEREGGKGIIVFPVRYPWKVRPDPERGTEGVRAAAVFRSKDERKPTYTTFRTAPEAQVREKEWWE